MVSRLKAFLSPHTDQVLRHCLLSDRTLRKPHFTLSPEREVENSSINRRHNLCIHSHDGLIYKILGALCKIGIWKKQNIVKIDKIGHASSIAIRGKYKIVWGCHVMLRCVRFCKWNIVSTTSSSSLFIALVLYIELEKLY